jgi:hypothetical protein
MAIVNNVAGGERSVRFILGVILVGLGFFLTSFWKPLLIIIGACFVITGFVGY